MREALEAQSAESADMRETRSIDEVLAWAGRPWYRFGWRSPHILAARFRNGRQWGFRLRMAKQRAVRGYGDDDLWSLNYALARLIVAGTTYMVESGHGYPNGTTPDEWNGTLEVIRLGFQEWLDADGCFEEAGSDAEKRFDDAAANLATWFGALWD